MKKFYVTMFAMLCGVAAMAQEGFSAKSIENAKAGETIDLAIEAISNAPTNAASFRLELPEGFKAKAKKYITLSRCSEDAADNGWVDVMILAAADGNSQYNVLVVDPASLKKEEGKTTFDGTDGVLVTIPVTIDASVAEGIYKIRLYSGQIGDAVGVEAIIPVGVGCTTAITSVNADAANAPIYNVAGQKVAKATKGIYIQNGKKIAVK